MITVSAVRVRKKARLDETYDADIQETIDEMVPYIESKIEQEYLDTEDTNIQAIINLGATEIIVGEFLGELIGEEEEVDLTLGPIKVSEKNKSKEKTITSNDWINKGWKRLKLYLKEESPFYFSCVEW